MAPLPAVPGTLRCACVHEDALSRQMISRFFLSYSGADPSPAELDTFAGQIAGEWSAYLAPLAATTITLTEVEVIALYSDTGGTGVTAPAASGGRTGTEVPADDCALVSYEISRRYRGGHPRGYWPFGVEADLADVAHWTTDFTDAVTDGMNSFIETIYTLGWGGSGALAQCNVSYFKGFTVVTNPLTGRARNIPTLRGTPVVDPIVTLLTRPRIGSQRRRRGKT